MLQVVVEDAQLLDDGRVFARLFARPLDVLAVLAAAGVGAVGRGDEGERAADAFVSHLL